MGTMLQAVCRCGYEKGFCQGGGMADFDEVDKEPAYCPLCRELVVVNHMGKRPLCPGCRHKITFYNDPSLASGEEVEKIQWGEFWLPARGCLCPKCGEMTLEFVQRGCYD